MKDYQVDICIMKSLVLLLLLVAPFVSKAQDDVYFVPKKAKKVLDVKSSEGSYFSDDVEANSEGSYTASYSDEEVDDVYYTDEPELLVENDYNYSTRIVRFRSPGRLYSSNLYWDLMYDCGVKDWLVHDTGYSLDIYPTVNNPLFYWSSVHYYPYDTYYAWRYNRWNWYMNNCTWFGINNHWAYFTPSWYYYPGIYYHHHHSSHWFGYGSWTSGHRVYRDIPTNSYNAGRTSARAGRPSNAVRQSGTNERGGSRVAVTERGSSRRVRTTVPNRVTAGTDRSDSGNKIAQDNREKDKSGGSAIKRHQPYRGVGVSAGKDAAGEKRVGENSGRKQPDRENPSYRGNGNKRGDATVKRPQRRTSEVQGDSKNKDNVRRSRENGTRENRREKSGYNNGSVSSSYERPSSTSVVRSRSGSSSRGSGSSSNRSSGGSSRGGSSSGSSRGGSRR